MIEKLRKKIIFVNLIAACIVFLAAMCFIFVQGYSRVDVERSKHINDALRYDVFQDAEDARFEDLAIAVYNLTTGEIKYRIGSKADISDDVLSGEAIEHIAQSSKPSGWASVFVRYVKKTNGDKVNIVFMNRYFGQNSLVPYFLSAVGVLVLGVGAYLLISWALSRVALKPIEKSWNQQKQFVADASHELKTPLSVIMANTEIIASHKDETVESQMKWIENTRSESKRMADLVANLLFLAKNDDGLKVQMEEVNVSECVETMVLSYDAVFYENGKKFAYEVAPDIITVGNKGQLQQLITILLDNANKYSKDEGNISLNVRTANKRIFITVSNDSEPLSEDQQAHLFDRFYTIDQSRNSDKGGNGLGLSIAQVICQTHEGEISVAYENGRTEFLVDLPVKRPKKESAVKS